MLTQHPNPLNQSSSDSELANPLLTQMFPNDQTNASQITSQTILLRSIDAMLEKHRLQTTQYLDTRLKSLDEKVSSMNSQLFSVKENQEAQGEMIDCLIMSSAKSKSKSANLLPSTAAQINTIRYVLTNELRYRVNAYIISKFVCREVAKAPVSDQDPFFVWDLFMFAPDSKSRDEARRTTFGTVFLNMRKSMALSHLSVSVKNAENLSEEEKRRLDALEVARDANENVDEWEAAHRRFRRPLWTFRGFIKPTHLLEVANEITKNQPASNETENMNPEHRNRSNSKRRKKNNSKLSRDEEIRVEVCRTIWAMGTESLGLCRYDGRKIFTKHMGFLFHDACGADWEFKMPQGYLGRMNEVPLAHTYVGEELECEAVAVAENRQKLKLLAERFPDLFVDIQYKVQVYPNEEARDRRRGPAETHRIAQRISIWEEAMTFLVYYFRMQKPEDYVRTVAESLKTLYLVAMAISKMLHEASEILKTNGNVQVVWKLKYPLGVMLETEKARIDAIESHVLHVTRRHYERLTRGERLEGNDTNHVQQAEEEHTDIGDGLLNPDILNADLV